MEKQFFVYKQDDSTFDLSNVFAGVLLEGVYAGFDFEDSSDLNLSLIHTLNGITFLDSDGTTLKENIGVFRTRQGVTVQRGDAITLPISSTLTFGRIDIVIATHSFLEQDGGQSAVISVLQGTASASPVAPSLTDPNRQTILGTLTLPPNCTALDQAGVSYVKNDATIFNKQNFDPDTKADLSLVESKADQTDLDSLESVVSTKADASLSFALTDAVNAFTKQQRFAKGVDITAPTNITLGDSGNFHRVSNGTVGTIQSVGNGTRIVLRPSGSGFTVLNGQTAGAGFKSILTPSGVDFSLSGVRDIVELIEDDDGWLVINMPYSVVAMPIGTIVTWTGNLGNIPNGWAWCDGNNGTVDLRGKFMYGTDDNIYPVGSEGGAATHTLTVDEIPDFGAETDAVIARVTGNNTPSGALDSSPDELSINEYTDFPTLGGQAHNNMPPYRSVIFIQKIS